MRNLMICREVNMTKFKIGPMIGLLFLIMAVVVLVNFGVSAMGVMDANANVSDDYSDTYNNTRDVSIVTMNLSGHLGLILGVCALIFGVAMIWKVGGF